MKAHYEKVLHNETSIAAFERKVPEFPFYWHYHPEFELTLILDSTGQRLVGDSIADYGPGDLVLLGPDLPHSWRSGPVKARAQEIHTAIVFQFRRDSLGDQFFALKELRPVAALLERSACGLEFGHTQRGAEAAQKLKEFYHLLPAQRLLLLVSVLLLLAEETDAHKLSTYPVQPVYHEKDQKRIELICQYLHEHFEEEIDFAALAERFHMDQASLCRFFKRATGRTLRRISTSIDWAPLPNSSSRRMQASWRSRSKWVSETIPIFTANLEESRDVALGRFARHFL